MSKPERIMTYLSDEVLKYFREDEKRLKISAAKILRKIVEEHYENRFSFLDADKVCDSLAYEGKDYRCVIGRIGKTPDIKKLGKTEEMTRQICRACTIGRSKEERLATLEDRERTGIVIMIHSCRKGAEINEDMTEMLCPETEKWRPITKRKKKTDYAPCRERGVNKTRCIYLVSTQTVIKGKLPADSQNL